MGYGTTFLFKGTVANGATQYVGLPIYIEDGSVGAHIAWLDATSSATITLETTSYAAQDAPVESAGSAWEWYSESGVTITGPAASAAGSFELHAENIRSKRARLKIVAAAACSFEIVGCK